MFIFSRVTPIGATIIDTRLEAIVTPTEIPRLLSAKEAAEVLLTSEGALAALRYRGAGPKFRKLGHRVAYAVQDLRDYIDSDIRTGTAADATA
ncbi:hypothetical protein RER_33310 [Rhodococcus erythropolis PR4]|uniref:Helix-turn-helix domain-containing protein n=1 Tax=Rhodococcus erythropolis (strain PR4 / NBRC 100887) TaxID=234621 RepID=C1A0A4_RHOE4|nr:hypothetical protein RER_33310 [Rhodococcus erythropolis PR4]